MNTDTKITEKVRLDWLDAVKAFAIFCIVLGHALNGYSFIWKFVYGFHVPLFIMVSGFTYTFHKEKFLKKFCKGFKRILVPYFVFAILSIFIYFFVGAKMDGDEAITLTQSVKGMFWANGETGIMRWNLPLWYLPMFFVLRMIACHVLSEENTTKKLVLKFTVFLIFASTIYYSGLITNLPFCFETVIYLFPFFVFGLILKRIILYTKKLKKGVLFLICILIMMISTIIIVYQKNIDYVCDEYRVYPLFLISALGISIVVVVLFSRISFPKIFAIIGKRTMPILLMHKFPLLFFEYVCPVTKDLYSSYRGITSWLISIVAILLCVVFSVLIEKVSPWIIGKENQNV